MLSIFYEVYKTNGEFFREDVLHVFNVDINQRSVIIQKIQEEIGDVWNFSYLATDVQTSKKLKGLFTIKN